VICSAYGLGSDVGVSAFSTAAPQELAAVTVLGAVSGVGSATGLMAELIDLSVRFMLTFVSCLTLWLTDAADVGDKILDFGNDI
jgi:hypothetical protein